MTQDAVFLLHLGLPSPFFCSDLSTERLKMAKELGADFQLTVKKGDESKQLAKSVAELLGARPHIAIECTGVESCIQTAIYVCDPRKYVFRTNSTHYS